MGASRGAVPTSFAATIDSGKKPTSIAGIDHPDRIPGKYIVVFNEEQINTDTLKRTLGENRKQVVDAYIETMALSANAKIRNVYDSTFSGFAMTVADDDAAQSLLQDPRVASVHADIVIRANAEQTSAPWGLDRVDQSALPLNTTYQYQQTGAGVTAYVLDSGINRSHPDFGGRAVPGLNFYNEDDSPGIIPRGDPIGHGTHVAGIIGSSTYGVAKGVTLRSLKILNASGDGNLSSLLAALNWLADHAVTPSVANMSVGAYNLDPNSAHLLVEVLNDVSMRGVIMVAAAGNNNVNACNHYPSRIGLVVGVGSTDDDDRRSSFSNWGNCVRIFAPGRNILSTYRPGSATATLSGTSMSAPHVAGAVALYLQNNPSATRNQVLSALYSTATPGVITNPGTNSPNRLLNTSLLMGLNDPAPLWDPNATPTTGLWHDPNNPGSGLHISKNGNGIYALYWFTYTPAGKPIWYIAGAGPINNGVWSTTLYKVFWNESTQSTSTQNFGDIRLEMTSNNTMRFKWDLDYINSSGDYDGTIDMVHYQGGESATGSWYEPEFSGWGVSSSYQNSSQGPDTVMFAFAYDGSQPVWTIGTLEGPPVSYNAIPMSYVTSTSDCPGCTGTGNPVYQSAGISGFHLQYSTGRGYVDLDFPSGNSWTRGRSNNPTILHRLTGN